MTVFYQFAPSDQAPFQFQPVLDGNGYLAVVTWNVFGQRWYVNLYDGSGNRVVTIPMIGSPDGTDINLIGGYFQTSVMVFRTASNRFEVTP